MMLLEEFGITIPTSATENPTAMDVSPTIALVSKIQCRLGIVVAWHLRVLGFMFVS